MNSSRLIIDTDVHNMIAGPEELYPFLPHYWMQRLKTVGYPNHSHGYRSPVGVIRPDAEGPNGIKPGTDPGYVMEHHMDAMGITYGILTGDQAGVSVWPDVDFGNAIASGYNDYVAERWLNFSDRYLGSITVNHSDPLAAAKEIDRVAKDRRFVQVIMCSASRALLGQRQYHPIYEAAERNGLPVAVHPGGEGSGVSAAPTPSGYPSLYFEWHNIIPINYMAHINSLVCEGVFEKFPKLKFVGLEGGISWLVHLMWRMDKNYKALRAMTPWLKRAPSEYIVEHVRLSTQPIEEPPNPSDLRTVFEMIHADKTIIFSSDYPHWDGDDPNHILGGLPDDMKERIFWGNAAELYRLSPPVAKKEKEHAAALSRL